MKTTIPDDAPIMFRMVRWTAELISKYAPRDDGRTPFQRIRNETCMTPLVPFGETVMYLFLQTAKSSKGEPAKKPGVSLGTIERTEEIIIGTKFGVVKCRIVNRLTTNERWDRTMVLGMEGAPWQPMPGRTGAHISVEIIDDDREAQTEDADDKFPDHDGEGEDVGTKLRGGPDRLHISKKAIAKYGVAPGCSACREIERRGHTAGRLGYNHNQTCRRRVFNEMSKEPRIQDVGRQTWQDHGRAGSGVDHTGYAGTTLQMGQTSE